MAKWLLSQPRRTSTYLWKPKGRDGITDSMDMSLSKVQEMVKVREAYCAAVHGVTKSRTWMSNWQQQKEENSFSYQVLMLGMDSKV